MGHPFMSSSNELCSFDFYPSLSFDCKRLVVNNSTMPSSERCQELERYLFAIGVSYWTSMEELYATGVGRVILVSCLQTKIFFVHKAT